MTALPRVAPSSAGVDAAGILDLIASQQAPEQELHSLMVLRHGQVLAEGWWDPYAPDVAQLVYSMSKTFTSAAVGLCVADGLFGYDDLVAELFADVVDGELGPHAASMKVRDVLAMAGGHSDAQVEKLQSGPFAGGVAAIGRWLAEEPEFAPGTHFSYDNPGTYLLSKLVTRTSGRTVHEIVRERILAPIGAEGESFWHTDAEGASLGFSGFHARTEMLARMGQLLLADGLWDDARVLPQEWIDEHRRHQVDCAGDSPDWQQGYGWQVWMSQHGYRLDGAFGQYALILPEQDMVIAATTCLQDMQRLLTAVWKHVIPAVDRPGSAESDAELARVLDEAALALLPASEVGQATSGQSEVLGAVRVEPASEGWTLQFGGPDAEQSVAVGNGTWAASTLRWGDATARVRSCGTWTPDGFAGKIVFVQSPHSLRVLVAPDRVETSWNLEPLHGPTPQHLAVRPG